MPRGGPDGGDGGDGGSVRIVCDPSVRTLASFRHKRRFIAGNGGNGAGRRKHGANGHDVELRVPEGTVITLEDAVGNRGRADLGAPGQEFVAPGGRGGRGNARFATSTNRYPLLAEQGEPGAEFDAVLDLKLIADVGIIGQPNAGKSSLLAALTAARPKVAAYPFSTLEPVLGVIDHRDQRAVLVDIPGLIEGAHEGVGLGHDFLRHIERAAVLVHVVDGSLDDPVAEYERVRNELHQYGEGVARKPEVVALNKSDIPGVREKLPLLRDQLPDRHIHCISAVARLGLEPMMDDVLVSLQSLETDEPQGGVGEAVVLRPEPADAPFSVEKRGRGYVVHADQPGRVAAMVDPADWEARAQLYGHLERVGVMGALQRAGAGADSVFWLGGKEWTWE